MSIEGPPVEETRVIPPGEVWPATVTKPFSLLMYQLSPDFMSMTPETRNTMMRGSLALRASGKEPGPEEASVVTTYTLPSLPPLVSPPHPSAPGKEGKAMVSPIVKARIVNNRMDARILKD